MSRASYGYSDLSVMTSERRIRRLGSRWDDVDNSSPVEREILKQVSEISDPLEQALKLGELLASNGIYAKPSAHFVAPAPSPRRSIEPGFDERVLAWQAWNAKSSR